MSNLEAILVKNLITPKLAHTKIHIRSYRPYPHEQTIRFYLELYSTILNTFAYIESKDNESSIAMDINLNEATTSHIYTICTVNIADPDFSDILSSSIMKLYNTKLNTPGQLLT